VVAAEIVVFLFAGRSRLERLWPDAITLAAVAGVIAVGGSDANGP
jgi:hypothetical protein